MHPLISNWKVQNVSKANLVTSWIQITVSKNDRFPKWIKLTGIGKLCVGAIKYACKEYAGGSDTHFPACIFYRLKITDFSTFFVRDFSSFFLVDFWNLFEDTMYSQNGLLTLGGPRIGHSVHTLLLYYVLHREIVEALNETLNKTLKETPNIYVKRRIKKGVDRMADSGST